MNGPDITGLPLDIAVERCKASGYDVEILFTLPAKASPKGRPRAVRFSRDSSNKGVLTVVLEVRGRGGGQSGIQNY